MPELRWEGKYDKDGHKVAPLRVALPFQTVETVNESAQQRQRTLDMFSSGRETDWRNRLIWGDKKYVLPALKEEFAGQIDLVYIDPPFATGADFSYTARVPDDPDTPGDQSADFTKQPTLIEQKAYRDTWGRGIESYLGWMYHTVTQLYELLAQTGTLYLHLDWRLAAYARVILDELFGFENFMCQIIWKRSSIRKARSDKWLSVDDVILVTTKSTQHTFNTVYLPYSEEYKKRFTYKDDVGYYYWIDIGTYSEERLQRLLDQDRVRFPETPGAHPRIKHYLHEGKGVQPDNVWTDIVPINSQAAEDTGYPTQKPEALLERIIRASSNEGDLVLDCFGGSGTTASVAERLDRRWIVCDLSRFGVHTTRKRLLSIPNVGPFAVQNMGKYERQLWQAAEFGEEAQARTTAYRYFILDVYKAKPIEGYAWLHGIKQGRLVHVGTVDAPVTVGDVKQIATEFRRAVGTGKDAPTSRAVDVLGWDFAFELNEVARQEASRAGIEVHFWRIPREVLDRRAVEQGDVRFFELAALAVEVTRTGRRVQVSLTDFIIPLDDVPEEVQAAITDWSQWIDYWAIDWDNKADTFHNEWQTYRTRKEPGLRKSAVHEYTEAGEYKIVVKVIDILGNDTTKTLTVEVL